MDSTHAETAVRFLAWKFKTSMPKLYFSGRVKRGRYKRNTTLCLPRECPVKLVAHEFSHHLDKQLNHVGFVWREWHSESFYFNLRRVIEALGLTDYPWTTEYRQIARWAKRDGLIS